MFLDVNSLKGIVTPSQGAGSFRSIKAWYHEAGAPRNDRGISFYGRRMTVAAPAQ